MKILIEIMQREHGYDIEATRVEFTGVFKGDTVPHTDLTLQGDKIEDKELITASRATSLNHALNLAADAMAQLKE
jgi:hypothetical protein